MDSYVEIKPWEHQMIKNKQTKKENREQTNEKKEKGSLFHITIWLELVRERRSENESKNYFVHKNTEK